MNMIWDNPNFPPIEVVKGGRDHNDLRGVITPLSFTSIYIIMDWKIFSIKNSCACHFCMKQLSYACVQ